MDTTLGRFMNHNLGEYHVPVNADIHDIQVIFVDEEDRANPLGVKGLGEIGTVGTAAAIANAVFPRHRQAHPPPADHGRQDHRVSRDTCAILPPRRGEGMRGTRGDRTKPAQTAGDAHRGSAPWAAVTR